MPRLARRLMRTTAAVKPLLIRQPMLGGNHVGALVGTGFSRCAVIKPNISVFIQLPAPQLPETVPYSLLTGRIAALDRLCIRAAVSQVSEMRRFSCLPFAVAVIGFRRVMFSEHGLYFLGTAVR